MDMIFARVLHADSSTSGLAVNDRALVTRSAIVPLSCTVCVTVTVPVVIVSVVAVAEVVETVMEDEEVMLFVLRLDEVKEDDNEVILLVLRVVEPVVLVLLVCVLFLPVILSLKSLLEVMLKELLGDVL